MNIDLMPIINALLAKYGWLAAVVTWLGVLRLINKPLFTIIKTITSATKTPKDDAVVEKIETSKFWKLFEFVLDYVGSIKLDVIKNANNNTNSNNT